ncbi:MAG: D-alanyl-D-alanine carboxypeptidase, partial [Oscillospiraceae bacterium]|nr:D-alanyl-D-alanine carboxypeptidase [Oscillospiraceae bacterium]
MKKTRFLCLMLILSILLSLCVSATGTEATNTEGTDTEATETTVASEETVPATEEEDFLTPPAPLREYNYPSDFTIDAGAYALIELKSNTILYSKELDMKRYPASITKIMTCMLAIEYGNLQDVLTVSPSALENLSEFGSSAGLVEGEEITLENMLYCIMLWSANEGCNVIAEYISQDIDSFVQLMNDTAKALGMENTHFANTHGLHDEDHYTTVRDLTILTRWAWQNETFRRFATATTYEVPATNKSDARLLHTTNYLTATDVDSRYYYSYASGIKTGFTTPAGGCLVSTATDGDAEYLSIVMGCDLISNAEDMRFIETKRLFRHAFETYAFVQVLTNTTMLGQPEVKNAKGRDNVVVHAKDEATVLLPLEYNPQDIIVKLRYEGELTAPLKQNEVVGTVSVEYQGVELAVSDLVTLTEVDAQDQNNQEDDKKTPTPPEDEDKDTETKGKFGKFL